MTKLLSQFVMEKILIEMRFDVNYYSRQFFSFKIAITLLFVGMHDRAMEFDRFAYFELNYTKLRWTMECDQ